MSEERRYRFKAGMTPGTYYPFDVVRGERVPGRISAGQDGNGQRLLTYVRELPRKGRKADTIMITAATVAELSAKLDTYFNTGKTP